MTEMLQSQIEVATPPCDNPQRGARASGALPPHARRSAAAEHKLGIAAMGTFPLAFWPEQKVTPKARYGAIMDDLQMIGYRNMLCGMHVHVAVPDVSNPHRSDHAADALSAAPARALDLVAVLARPSHRPARLSARRL